MQWQGQELKGRPLQPSGEGRWGLQWTRRQEGGDPALWPNYPLWGQLPWALQLYLLGCTVPFADFGLVLPPQKASRLSPEVTSNSLVPGPPQVWKGPQ